MTLVRFGASTLEPDLVYVGQGNSDRSSRLQIERTAIDGITILTPPRFGDHRGWFSEVWNDARLKDAGIADSFVQDNHSYSAQKGTLRGLHYQAPPHAQAKLVRCVAGSLWDVAVDARRGSPTYGTYVAVELSAENGKQLFIPAGFLHGFITLTPDAELVYKCSDYYAPAADGAVRWDSLGIEWPLEGEPTLSDKDAAAPAFGDWDSPFEWSAS